MNFQNIKKRIILIIIAVASYIFVPIPLGFLFFPAFHPVSFPISGYIMHAIQIFVSLILVYGAFAWIKPSLVPSHITKKIVIAVMCGIIIVMIIPSGVFTLEPVGSCTITNNSQGTKTVSSNSQSTEQNCIDGCISAGHARYNAVACEFEGIDRSWSKTPENFEGYKPNL